MKIAIYEEGRTMGDRTHEADGQARWDGVRSWMDGSQVTRFRLAGIVFDAQTEAEFAARYESAVQAEAQRCRTALSVGDSWPYGARGGLCYYTDGRWWNANGVHLGVYVGETGGRWEIRGFGLSFLSVSSDAPCTDLAWDILCHKPPRRKLLHVECRPGQTPEQTRLSDLYNEIVSLARNQRRQIMYRSPNLPLQRACVEEERREDDLTELGSQYREAALAYRPGTDWSAWRSYVRNTVRSQEVADLVIGAVCRSV